MSSSHATETLDKVYTLFMDDKRYPAAAQKNIGERVCLPLMNKCEQSALVAFFVSRIKDIMSVIEAKMNRVNDIMFEVI